jgi:hypothetical protein
MGPGGPAIIGGLGAPIGIGPNMGPGGTGIIGGPGGLGWHDASSRIPANKDRATTKAAINFRILMVVSLDSPGLKGSTGHGAAGPAISPTSVA